MKRMLFTTTLLAAALLAPAQTTQKLTAGKTNEYGLIYTLPVTVIEKDLSNRMASTIRHNRARGTHNVELMSEIVAELTRANMSDQWIMRHIGMDRDELLRLKQITGLADLFADKEFSLGDTDEDSVEEMLEV